MTSYVKAKVLYSDYLAPSLGFRKGVFFSMLFWWRSFIGSLFLYSCQVLNFVNATTGSYFVPFKKKPTINI